MVELIRNGSRMTVDVTLGELEKAELVGIVGEQVEGDAESFEKLGFAVDNLNAELAAELGLDESMRGVVVTEVVKAALRQQGTPAW